MHRERRLISLKEACGYLDIHPSSMYRMLKRGEINAIKIGSDWFFEYAKLDQWIDARPHGVTATEKHPGRKKSPNRD